MKKFIRMMAAWLLWSGLMAQGVYANDTIRWTWHITDATAPFTFALCGTAGGEFGIDMGDGQTDVLPAPGTGEFLAFGGTPYADTGVYDVRLYALTADARITGLKINSERLLSLDVSGCTALTSLDCSNNDLPSLDVSGCTALAELNCRNNDLASLNVSGCTALTSLDCSGNDLTSLDVSDCTALTELNCRNNDLASLNVSGCTALTSLGCSGNDLTSLDVSGCTALTALVCNNNHLISLDVSQHVALKLLYCANNALTSLDASGCVSLTALHCPNNTLSFNAVAAIALSLPQAQTEGFTCEFSPQRWSRDTIEIRKGVPVPERPVIKGTQARLDVYRNGILLDGQGYTIQDGKLYFDKAGSYKLAVWHDSVRNRTYGYDENYDRLEINVPYADTTFVTIYSDYADGNDMVRWTWQKEKSDYKAWVSLSFGGTAGETFVLDWGDGTRTVVEGSGEMVSCSHTYDTVGRQVEWRLYGTSPEAHILKFEKNYVLHPHEKLDFSACPELTYLRLNNWASNDECFATLDVSGCRALTYLECPGMGLTSLDVRACPALAELHCRDNRLASLNVSKNVNLTVLDCGYNQLRSLDVTKNVNLTALDCSANQLRSLDVTKNVDLTDLNCGQNQLGSLELSKNTALTYLSCHFSRLTALDISRNVNLEELNCRMNLLSALDISKNVNLTKLYCSENYLTSLDVSRNVNLCDLDCGKNHLTSLDVTQNVNLKELGCYLNLLTSLDMTRNADLACLHCNDNRLDSLDVSQNTALTDLSCEDNRLTSLDISRNTALTDLRCDGNRLTSLDISQNPDLQSLYCANNRLTSLDLSGQVWLNTVDVGDNFFEVPLDGQRAYDLATLPGMDVERIQWVNGGRLEGTRMVFEADEVRYLYATGYQPENSGSSHDYDTLWFRLVADRHDDPQIPLTAEFFPDSIFRAYVTRFDRNGNDSLCAHECAAVKEIYVGGDGDREVEIWHSNLQSLEGLQYFGNLEDLACVASELTSLDVSQNVHLKRLWCYHNQLTSLDVSHNVYLFELYCGHNQLKALDVSHNAYLFALDCGYNQLTALDISHNGILKALECMENRMPLSSVARLVQQCDAEERWGTVWTPQRIPVSLKSGQALDLSREMMFFGCATKVDFGDVAASDYTFSDGQLKFTKEGVYQVRLTNDSVRVRDYRDSGKYTNGDAVEVFYDITVTGGGSDPDDPTDPDDPDDPDDPTDPDDPDDPTANEDLVTDASVVAPWAYVQGRMVYLTADDLGEVEAFTAVGRRVYRGHDRAFSVPTAGIYVLRAADGRRRCKVMVR